MRFREYESTPSNGPHTDQQQECLEYHLSPLSISTSTSTSKGKNDNNGTLLVWSVPKSKLPSSSSNDNDDATTKSSSILINNHLTNKIRRLCQDLFLPIGYPSSVADGYLEYQFYDSLQGLCSYLRGVVSTSAVLSATGVGDAEATAMSAAMTWAVRDGLGMIGGLLFSYIASPHFDAHVKEFRLLADVLNDVGLTLDMALPFLLTQSWFSTPQSCGWVMEDPNRCQSSGVVAACLPSSYLVLTSASMLCKVACGMAAGATKGNITDHFAISGNRADCQSKESTQETLVSLVGMCLGVWFANILHRLERNAGKEDQDIENCVNDNEDDHGSGVDGTCDANSSNNTVTDVQMITWSIFVILTVIHVWANYVGMQMLRLRTLNHERAKVALQPLVEDCGRWVLSENASRDNTDDDISQRTNTIIKKASSNILPPKSVSESLWKSMYGMVRPGNIHLGVGLNCLVRRSSSSPNDAKRLSSTCKWSCGHWDSEKYMIFVDGRCEENSNNFHSITVLLRMGANDRDELQAFVHASILNWCIKQDANNESARLSELLSRSYEIIQRLFQPDSIDNASGVDLYSILRKKGWDMTRFYLGFGPRRCEWDDKDD